MCFKNFLQAIRHMFYLTDPHNYYGQVKQVTVDSVLFKSLYFSICSSWLY